MTDWRRYEHIQFRPTEALSSWLEQQRRPDESPGQTARRLLESMEKPMTRHATIRIESNTTIKHAWFTHALITYPSDLDGARITDCTFDDCQFLRDGDTETTGWFKVGANYRRVAIGETAYTENFKRAWDQTGRGLDADDARTPTPDDAAPGHADNKPAHVSAQTGPDKTG